MQMLDERPIGSPNRKLPTVASWQTRFLVTTENNQASTKPPVLDSVRTHLKCVMFYFWQVIECADDLLEWLMWIQGGLAGLQQRSLVE